MPRTPTLLLTALLLAACAEDSNTELEVAHDTESEAAGEDDDDEIECSAAQQERVDLILAKTPNQAAGAELFPQLCGTALCHGSDGVSGPGPSLAEEIPEYSIDQLACILLVGPGDMTSLETLADQQLADVIAYVRATF